jgi:hypothetical protein
MQRFVHSYPRLAPFPSTLLSILPEIDKNRQCQDAGNRSNGLWRFIPLQFKPAVFRKIDAQL